MSNTPDYMRELYIDRTVQERELWNTTNLLLGAIIFMRVVAVRHSRTAIHEWGSWGRHDTHGRHMLMSRCHRTPRCLHWVSQWSMVHCSPDATQHIITFWLQGHTQTEDFYQEKHKRSWVHHTVVPQENWHRAHAVILRRFRNCVKLIAHERTILGAGCMPFCIWGAAVCNKRILRISWTCCSSKWLKRTICFFNLSLV